MVTVTNGQTTITSGNISPSPDAPFLTETLTQKISETAADIRYVKATQIQTNALLYGIDAGTTNALVVNLSPALTTYVPGMRFLVEVANTNTAAATLSFNNLPPQDIYVRSAQLASPGDMEGGTLHEFAYNGKYFLLLNPTSKNRPGDIIPRGGLNTPVGWLDCDGLAVNRIIYANLLEDIGTYWGAGDGVTTFNVPNICGRTLIGTGNGPGLSPRAIGQFGGEEMHTQSINELASHQHDYPTAPNANPGSVTGQAGSGAVSNRSTYLIGGGAAANIMQPFAVTNYIIKT